MIPPTRYVFGAFGGTQRTVGATLAEFAVQELKAAPRAGAHDDDYGKANVATIRAVAARLGSSWSRPIDFAARHRRDGADVEYPRRQSGRDHLHGLSTRPC